MKILITGGCGFIGSTAAERFHKEGHQIYIIDNLSGGDVNNVTVPHKLYPLNVEDRACDVVFESVRPDVVVHLAAQVDVTTSMKIPQADAQTNIMGLVNMLECSRRHGVKKFLFASSAAVYGNDEAVPLAEAVQGEPVSPYGINKKLGEYYCAKWQELYGLQTLAFRFANVYGPKQGGTGEGGVVSIYMKRMVEQQELVVYGDGNQTRDFIYVEDIVDGLYRGAESDLTGVYNLSCNHEIRLNELIDALQELGDSINVRYEASREGDIYRSSLDNTRVKRDLDWVPLFSLKEGLAKTYSWFLANAPTRVEKAAVKKKQANSVRLLKKLRPYGENLLACIALYLLINHGPSWLTDMNVDFKLVYIFIIGVLYGSKQSVISAVLASGLYFADNLQNGREWVSLLYDPEVLFILALYLFFGLVVGFVSDKHKRETVEIGQKLQVEQERYDFLNTVYKDTRYVKDELQRQLIGSKDSIGRIYNIVKELESHEPEDVVSSSIHVLENLLETKQISIYAVNQTDYLRLMIKSGNEELLLPKTIRMSEHGWVKKVVESQTIFVNRTMSSEAPMMAAPVINNGVVVSIISIHDVNFARLNLNYQNVFKMTVEMISNSLARAFQFVGATSANRYVGETPVLQENWFRQVVESKLAAKKQHNAEFVLLTIQSDEKQSVRHVVERVADTLRESDYIGMIRNEIVLLLNNSNEAEAAIVIRRLEKNGITARVLNGEEAYAG
ncbi:NAD-dependent epimerase/dehydratase [Paenibacillus curdlanolyticus YK9]|uniref:NAD-dependent epimerase/dehydratase n=1 Tax=Paenibacillus curdlanolyticus YK9 TaxID=717606 RepID=E0I9W5_9BACL|nr:NAD-dependent epimerase/dehydratase family protein [Paenibacillus curdlanolyticus]EFM10542.1 NAD-dependent epimerase/dehydratase [Paenibacillus curdlanolyticus YK9]